METIGVPEELRMYGVELRAWGFQGPGPRVWV